MSKVFLQNISHVYNQEDQKIKVLNNINLRVFKGEMLALTGPSGTGKSTLLKILSKVKDYLIHKRKHVNF